MNDFHISFRVLIYEVRQYFQFIGKQIEIETHSHFTIVKILRLILFCGKKYYYHMLGKRLSVMEWNEAFSLSSEQKSCVLNFNLI